MGMYLSYFGIRVTNLEASLKFYTVLFGLQQVRQGDSTRNGGGRYVLLKDPRSGQKLELNWYPPNSPYSVEYQPGEGLDHIAFKVDSVSEKVKELASKGVEVIGIPESIANPVLENPYTVHQGFVKDPDGNWIALYDQSKPIGSTVSETY
jgi:catechol 2,3-dioxygenase-like lactoylglutathione lyase family enzyme